jgi:hypothetical protein
MSGQRLKMPRILLSHKVTPTVKSEGSRKELPVAETAKLAPSCLRGLYLSNCEITSVGATFLSKILSLLLPHLELLSLGSNPIDDGGAVALARAFAGHANLTRVALNRNDRIAHPGKDALCEAALDARGWSATAPAAAVLRSLVRDHVRRRLEKDCVAVRPFELAWRRLREEVHRCDVGWCNLYRELDLEHDDVDREDKKYLMFLDEHLQVMPDLLSWMGQKRFWIGYGERNGGIIQQLQFGSLNELYRLFSRVPQLIPWLQSFN